MSAAIDPPALSQSELMEVLYRLYDARGDQGRSRIRNRFKSLLKVDLPTGKRPQHGKREKYNFQQVCEVVVCFSLAQYGIDAWMLGGGMIGDISQWANRVAEIGMSKILKREYGDMNYAMFQLKLVSSSVGESADIVLYSEENGSSVADITQIEALLLNGGCLLNLETTASILLHCLPAESLLIEGKRSGSTPPSAPAASQKGRRGGKPPRPET